MKDINAKKLNNHDLDRLAKSYVAIIIQSGIEEITNTPIFDQLTEASRLFREKLDDKTSNEVITLNDYRLLHPKKNNYLCK